MTRLDWALTHNVPHSVVRIAGDVVSILSLGLWTPKWADRFSDWRFAKAVGVDLRTLEAELRDSEYQGDTEDDWFDDDEDYHASTSGRDSLNPKGCF